MLCGSVLYTVHFLQYMHPKPRPNLACQARTVAGLDAALLAGHAGAWQRGCWHGSGYIFAAAETNLADHLYERGSHRGTRRNENLIRPAD